jgi:hypothetical protein
LRKVSEVKIEFEHIPTHQLEYFAILMHDAHPSVLAAQLRVLRGENRKEEHRSTICNKVSIFNF